MQQDAHEFLNFLINHINEIIAGLKELILKFSIFSTIFNLHFLKFNCGQHSAKCFYCFAKCHIFIVLCWVRLCWMSVILRLIKLGCYLTEYRCNDCIECLNWNLYWFVLAEKTQATTKSKSTTPDLTTSTTASTENSTPTWINDIFQVFFWSLMSIWSF